MSIGVAGAGDRAGSERQRVGLVARRFEPRVIAAQRRGVAQQEVRDQHRHRAPHVRVRRHQRIAGVLGLIGKRGDRRAQLLPASSGMRRRRYSRRSTETCSLRDRPVCRRRPASPMRATSWRSTKLCTSSSSPLTHDGSRAALLEDRGEALGDRRWRRRRRARRRAPALRPTPGCRSRRLRTGGDRTGTTRRNQTPPDRAPSQTVRTTTALTFQISDLRLLIASADDLRRRP